MQVKSASKFKNLKHLSVLHRFATCMIGHMDIVFENMQTLLIAPTGWGKTTLLLDIIKHSQKKIVYFSPLKALANEFYLRALKDGIKVFAPQSMGELAQKFDIMPFQLLITTFEKVSDLIYGKLIDGDYLFVFDEVHLNHLWGDQFRPLLKDFLEQFLYLDLDILLLSATVDDELIHKLLNSTERLTIINIANFKLKKAPKQIFYARKKYQLLNHLEYLHKKRTLVFCKYRSEVKELAELYERKGFRVLSCISGEVEEFQRKLLLMPNVEFIFSTSTLSHGVNLPKLSSVSILYPVESYAMWTQMVGRAGRRGEEFDVYQMNSYRYEKSHPIFNYINWILKFYRIKIKYAIRGYFSS